MNLLVLADPKVSQFCFRTRIFKKWNSWEQAENDLRSSLPESILKNAMVSAGKISDEVRELGFDFISFFDEEYPPLLKEIFDPPLILFIKGNRNILRENFAAVVGTREPSPISSFASTLLPSFLKTQGFFGIVSGLAKGIDAVSMRYALDEGLDVIGVLGTGPETEYPNENKNLYRSMKESDRALILTEYPPGHVPLKYSFPKRNRIITGICSSVFIMEAPEKSGAISSAHNAIEQNRQIFIFSHPSQTRNQGGELLIREGADVLDLKTISLGMEEVFHSNELLPDSQSEIPGMLAELSKKRFSGEWNHIGSGYYARKTNSQSLLPGL
ncbi:DNA-processing protein DprA [Leptospira stimsonii]|uniref:DNA processing protein DprA n=1 Tax=Leptospira stimsonii TaxID=2202203 RepID=A0A4R9L994_9LEPT|nr:DNA-processing protein DprA [Leptospira stimsonii]RHX88291.1 DNA processing protein DprA [Leptospira stimsonii]TGK26348.1 DNA-processing protein DprA [Leptospira stimsonii]TGM20213.1 DNA-processing protein DprA [Leptospira stimsonii]